MLDSQRDQKIVSLKTWNAARNFVMACHCHDVDCTEVYIDLERKKFTVTVYANADVKFLKSEMIRMNGGMK